ncbi:MAG: hypothetical protein E7474_03465 [Ruminococcaceae bacterium]|nr:hypothetical protein [Oscillospiraceae bacterium]
MNSEAVVTSAIEKAANSLCRSLQEIGYNGAIGLTQTTGLTNICGGWSKKGYYVLMGTAVVVE